MTSPSWEVPTREAALVQSSPSMLSYVSAMTIPAGVALASVATVAPQMVASGGNSWNHMLGSVQGCIYQGVAVGALWGCSVAFPPKCSRGCVCRAGLNSDNSACRGWRAM